MLKLFCIFLFLPQMLLATDFEDKYFEIYRNGNLEGYQTLNFTQDGDQTIVDIDILIEVNFAFITVYRYVHKNQEVWRGNQLISIDTTTDNDGEKQFVRGQLTDAGFVIESTKFNGTTAAGIIPTSYWNPQFAEQSTVLNSQTGEIFEVDFASPGSEEVMVRGELVRAKKVQCTGDLTKNLWYHPTMGWVKSAFSFKGSDFEYKLVHSPANS